MIRLEWTCYLDEATAVHRFEAREHDESGDGDWVFIEEISLAELAGLDDQRIAERADALRARAVAHRDLILRANDMVAAAGGECDLHNGLTYLPHLAEPVDWMPCSQDDHGAWNVDLAHARVDIAQRLAAACAQVPRAGYDVVALDDRCAPRSVSVSYAGPDTVDVAVSELSDFDGFPRVVIVDVPVETSTELLGERLDVRLADIDEAASRGWTATSVQRWTDTTVRVKAHPANGPGALEEHAVPVSTPDAPIDLDDLGEDVRLGSLRATGDRRMNDLLARLNRT